MLQSSIAIKVHYLLLGPEISIVRHSVDKDFCFDVCNKYIPPNMLIDAVIIPVNKRLINCEIFTCCEVAIMTYTMKIKKCVDMLDKSGRYCYYIKTERTLFFKTNEREVQ